MKAYHSTSVTKYSSIIILILIIIHIKYLYIYMCLNICMYI